MIKPPFTVLIIKNSHHPLTIRVTTGFIILTFGFISLAGAFIGFAITFYVFSDSDNLSAAVSNKSSYEYNPVQPVNDDTGEKPYIQSFSVTQNKSDVIELKLKFTPIPATEEIYVWVIVNPDSEIASEMVVYPRNPIFRGLPVDYRNGITYFPSEGSDVTITLSEDTAGIMVERLRLLVYSADGKIITDSLFSRSAESSNQSSMFSSQFVFYNS